MCIRDSQWHQLGHMQVCTLLQTDNHTSTPSLFFLQAGCNLQAGCFGRNTVTETEFRSVSTSISQQFCSIASLHCRIDPLPISKSSILNGTSELIAPGRRSDESLLCTALYTLWGGRKFYFCLKRTLVRSNISCLQNEDFPF